MSIGHRLRAWGSLLSRYRKVFAFHWARRQELEVPLLRPQEAEFLPAALSLQATPISPALRLTGRVLIALTACGVAWVIVGEVDIIVNASGRVVPSGRTKTIASVEVARVAAVRVAEGTVVRAGDVLVELDTRVSDSEHDKARGDEQIALLQAARSRAMLSGLERGVVPRLPRLSELPRERFVAAEMHLEDQWRDYMAKRRRLDDAISRISGELPLATQRAVDYKTLAQSHDVAEHAWIEKEQARMELEGQLADTRRQRDALYAETRRMAQDALHEAMRVLNESEQDAKRAAAHTDLLKLTSPVDGTVQQLTVHTVGGVVPAAQAPMQIVPLQSVVEVEAFVDNKDVGFVREGQRAQVKIDAFPYVRYGTVSGYVSHVSRDAVQDEKRGWVYSVKVLLDEASLAVDGRQVPVAPGMTGGVEIKTGTRRLVEYLLSPLMEHARESLRER
jgi:hemolysin D